MLLKYFRVTQQQHIREYFSIIVARIFQAIFKESVQSNIESD